MLDFYFSKAIDKFLLIGNNERRIGTGGYIVFEGLGQQALIHLFVNVMFLAITWWALQAFKFDLFVKEPNSPKAKALVILVTIAIAQLVSSFFLDYYNASTMLRYLW
ncbi:DUF1146 family protein [Bacillus sp. LL01]|uniref:DUF1146 family protein n=1 Tax=Bacillus sp. LL01 TaxID=1665556 RepID=UPI0026D4F054